MRKHGAGQERREGRQRDGRGGNSGSGTRADRGKEGMPQREAGEGKRARKDSRGKRKHGGSPP